MVALSSPSIFGTLIVTLIPPEALVKLAPPQKNGVGAGVAGGV
jgi:hypothetical protein